MEVAVGSEVGLWQKHQSDAHLTEAIAPGVTFFGIADGFGEVARSVPTASLALSTVRDYLRRRQRLGAFGARAGSPGSVRALLLAALDHANARLFAQSGSHEDFVGSGASLTAVLIVGHHAFIAHVGDARAYLLRLGHLETLTADDAMFARRGGTECENLAAGKAADARVALSAAWARRRARGQHRARRTAGGRCSCSVPTAFTAASTPKTRRRPAQRSERLPMRSRV